MFCFVLLVVTSKTQESSTSERSKAQPRARDSPCMANSYQLKSCNSVNQPVSNDGSAIVESCWLGFCCLLRRKPGRKYMLWELELALYHGILRTDRLSEPLLLKIWLRFPDGIETCTVQVAFHHSVRGLHSLNVTYMISHPQLDTFWSKNITKHIFGCG